MYGFMSISNAVKSHWLCWFCCFVHWRGVILKVNAFFFHKIDRETALWWSTYVSNNENTTMFRWKSLSILQLKKGGINTQTVQNRLQYSKLPFKAFPLEKCFNVVPIQKQIYHEQVFRSQNASSVNLNWCTFFSPFKWLFRQVSSSVKFIFIYQAYFLEYYVQKCSSKPNFETILSAVMNSWLLFNASDYKHKHTHTHQKLFSIVIISIIFMRKPHNWWKRRFSYLRHFRDGVR